MTTNETTIDATPSRRDGDAGGRDSGATVDGVGRRGAGTEAGQAVTAWCALELGRDAGGPRYFLDERPVHAGTLLEVQRDPRGVERVRFEWNGLDAPWLYADDGGRRRAKPWDWFRWPPGPRALAP